ncbi:ribonuclease H-like domain, reverse transcriptase, RNA-dependent DNA polymerase [Tanacetum coccineum]
MNFVNQSLRKLFDSINEKTKRIHDAKIKNRVFNVGDRVLLFNSRLKIFSGKLKSRWSGPFTVTQVFPYGTVELSQNSGPNFKVNGHRIKHYFGGDIPTEVVPDLQTISRFVKTLKYPQEFHILSFIVSIDSPSRTTDPEAWKAGVQLRVLLRNLSLAIIEEGSEALDNKCRTSLSSLSDILASVYLEVEHCIINCNQQAPRAWNIKLDNTLKSLDFKKCALEQAIYTKKSKDSILLIGVYVDDLIITGTPKKEIDKFKAQMEKKFEMSDLGLLAYYLGIEVTQTNGDISIKQSAYASKILKEAGIIDCNETLIPMDPGTRLTKIIEGTMVNSTEYRSLIGCLRYLLHTRPDLSYSVRLLSRFMQEPREQHMKAIRQVLRYVKGTKDHGITYKHNGGNKIHGYSDSSYGVNTQEGKGTTGIIFYYGESPISWSTQKQATVALSSCESEFIAATAAATQALWLKRLLSKLTHTQEEKITIQVDNKSAIALMKNPVFHGRSKHIDTKYHFIRECVEREDIQVEFVSGEYQKADILTKALPKIKFLTMRQLIGLKDLSHSAYD